jgi:hypothetical protein
MSKGAQSQDASTGMLKTSLELFRADTDLLAPTIHGFGMRTKKTPVIEVAEALPLEIRKFLSK